MALATILLGVEVATGVVSLGAVRLWTGLEAHLAGDEYLISRSRYSSGVWLMLVGAGLLAVVVYAELARGRIEPGGAVCPQCGTETQRVRRRHRHRVLSMILEGSVTRRYCHKCGWRGLTA